MLYARKPALFPAEPFRFPDSVQKPRFRPRLAVEQVFTVNVFALDDKARPNVTRQHRNRVITADFLVTSGQDAPAYVFKAKVPASDFFGYRVQRLR